MSNVIMSAKGLCKSFAHDGGQVHVLSHIDVELYEGDFTVVCGASGSGKSTLLYALSGMDNATAGEVLYYAGKLESSDGKKEAVPQNIVKMKEKELAKLRYSDFGFIFQQMHLVSNLSLFENVVVSGYLNKSKSVAEVKKRADELFEQMGISHIKAHLPSQVSGGEQQRCAIARAVINEPKLLFADEPTGALNRKNTTEVLNLLTDINKAGQSVLMVTHDVKAALRANRILYIADGKIVGELTLPPFNMQDEKSRETQVNAWLSSMEW